MNVPKYNYCDKPVHTKKDFWNRIKEYKPGNKNNEDNKKKLNYFKMNNNEDKDCYRKKNMEEEYSNKFTEDVIYNTLFIVKSSNQEHDSKIFIVDSGAISHMVNLEENMTNLYNFETRVTIGDSITLTGTNLEIGIAIRDMVENPSCYVIKYGRNIRPTLKYIQRDVSTKKKVSK